MTPRLLAAAALIALAARGAAAQSTSTPAPQPASPDASVFGITDNSFLVEESFNQDPGVVQHIFVIARSRHGGWDGSFTQEWPLHGERHQISFTLPFSVVSGTGGVGDVLVNYRYQLSDEHPGSIACSPRISAIAPTSADRRPLGVNGWGLQVDVPISKRFDRFYVHVNGGGTWLRDGASTAPGRPPWTSSPFSAASVIWAARPMFNLMLETFVEADPAEGGGHDATTTILPGFRTGWNFGKKQVVIGAGVPVTRGAMRDVALLGYLSFEGPVR